MWGWKETDLNREPYTSSIFKRHLFVLKKISYPKPWVIYAIIIFYILNEIAQPLIQEKQAFE